MSSAIQYRLGMMVMTTLVSMIMFHANTASSVTSRLPSTISSINENDAPAVNTSTVRLSGILAKLTEPTTMNIWIQNHSRDYLNQTITSESITITFRPSETTCKAPFNDWEWYPTTTTRSDGSVSTITMHADYLCINHTLVPTTTLSVEKTAFTIPVSSEKHPNTGSTSKSIMTTTTTKTGTATSTMSQPPGSFYPVQASQNSTKTTTLHLTSTVYTTQSHPFTNTSMATKTPSRTDNASKTTMSRVTTSSTHSSISTSTSTSTSTSSSFSPTALQPIPSTSRSEYPDTEPSTTSLPATTSLLRPNFTPKKRNCTPKTGATRSGGTTRERITWT